MQVCGCETSKYPPFVCRMIDARCGGRRSLVFAFLSAFLGDQAGLPERMNDRDDGDDGRRVRHKIEARVDGK